MKKKKLQVNLCCVQMTKVFWIPSCFSCVKQLFSCLVVFGQPFIESCLNDDGNDLAVFE